MRSFKINTDKLKFKLDGLSLFWQTHSGRSVCIEASCSTDTPREIIAGEDGFRLALSEFRSWLSRRGHYIEVPRRSNFVSQSRMNLDRRERETLATLVSELKKGEGYVSEVVDFLNDSGADENLLNDDNFKAATNGEIVHGACGHFHEACDGYTAAGRETICGSCADDSDQWLVPEDSSNFYRRDDLYCHNDYCWYTYEEAEDEEEDEDEENERGSIRSYNYDITRTTGGPKFDSTAQGRFTIGVELEMECESNSVRNRFIERLESSHTETIVCKADGSIDDTRGVELVTAPMEYTEAVDLFKGLVFPKGSTAWDTTVCGTHVHIDSRAFTPLSLAKFLLFWNDDANKELIYKVAGRHPDESYQGRSDNQARSFAQAVGRTTDVYNSFTGCYERKEIDKSPAGLLKFKAYPGLGSTRYRIVNLTNLSEHEKERLGVKTDSGRRFNFSTVELRIFRASLKKERTTAQIEMTAASVYFARAASLSDMTTGAFLAWVGTNSQMFPNLAAFLGLKKAHTAPKDFVAPDDDGDCAPGFDFAAVQAKVLAAEALALAVAEALAEAQALAVSAAAIAADKLEAERVAYWAERVAVWARLAAGAAEFPIAA